MGFGKSIGSYLVDIIKAEKQKSCDICINKKQWNVLIQVYVITQKKNLILRVN